MKNFAYGLVLLVATTAGTDVRAQKAPLTVEQIMQDPKTWIGAWPSKLFWSEDGETLYFHWNPQGRFPADSLFKVSRGGGEPVQVPAEERRRLGPRFDGWHHGRHVYDADYTRKVYEHQGDLYLYDRTSRTVTRLTDTRARETDPRFAPHGRHVIFRRENNLFRLDLESGVVKQLTDLRAGEEPTESEPDEQDALLKQQQAELFAYIRKQQEEKQAREAAHERDRAADDPPPVFYTGSKRIEQLQLDPAERFVTFALKEEAPSSKKTKVVRYVTDSGYAEVEEARPKVGVPDETGAFYVQDLERDTTYQVDLHQLPGAYDVPAFLRENGVELDSSAAKRLLTAHGPYWSGDGRFAVLDVRTEDNKDRWIVRLDPASGELTVLDRQHDDAWIGGPGISWWGGRSTVGWLPNDRHFYFQSERTGYSHLYVVDVGTGAIRQLTDGTFEVFDPMLSRDGRTWFFTSSEGSPFERHFYRMPVDGGTRTRLTAMDGFHTVALNPDEATMAMLHSVVNRPPEVFLQSSGGTEQRITHSPTDMWSQYSWRDPEIVRYGASDGAQVPAHLFVPDEPNGAAVLFVHGAGYLQNVMRGWSGPYFREYMFHNLLADRGYVVMNVDYRGSAGYGRDWRTAIYRHMGGRDLQDYVDATRYLEHTYGIDPERVFIYGGSYGGFLTLMALFTEPEHFGGGAALRSVTDWAHYNHTYTANILNTPAQDSLAYVRSSPIYHAEGLEDPLLIAHGFVDLNVQFQDVARLAQRLIELGKVDWELAVYPVEGHGFTEPTSWADEYRRILALIEESVGPERRVEVPARPDEGD